jgi:hypothetical protein
MTAETVPRIVPVGSKNRASRANANSRLLQSRTKNRRILENRPFYAASRMSQLRKLSSAASHFLRKTCDLTLSSFAMKHRMVAGSILPGNSLRKHVQMALPQRAVPRNVAPSCGPQGESQSAPAARFEWQTRRERRVSASCREASHSKSSLDVQGQVIPFPRSDARDGA